MRLHQLHRGQSLEIQTDQGSREYFGNDARSRHDVVGRAILTGDTGVTALWRQAEIRSGLRVKGNASPFIETGTIFLASNPTLAASHSLNVEGYSGFGQYYAYIFHEGNGELMQWIQKGPNVSWCLKFRTVNSDQLKCTGPSAYVPSNGYAYQALPFVPTTVLGPVKDFLYGLAKRRPPVVTGKSKTFGPLHCLLQTSGSPHLRTCVNDDGLIVSSTYRQHHNWWTVTLETLNHDPTTKDFTTLLKSSREVPLPPP